MLCGTFLLKFTFVLTSFVVWGIFAILMISSVDGRQAIKPHEDVGDVIKQLNHINAQDIDTEGPAACLLDVQKDFPRPNELQPLYLVPDTNQYWMPNEKGQLQIPHGASIELHCTKSFANGTTAKPKATANTRTIRPRCLLDKNFLWQGEKYEFRQFICEKSTRYTIEQLHEKCPPSVEATKDGLDSKAEMYRVGYNISRNRFVETMRICHDNDHLRTLYVQHVLLPASIHFQRFVKRLNFSKAGYFKDFNMHYLYSHHNQQQQASLAMEASLQGGGQHVSMPMLFDNNTLFLARGHLAAKADYIYASQQRSTFNFFNVAPQWQAFNGGQWATLEDEVRKYVARSKLMVDCYTGTWGIMQLSSSSKSPTSGQTPQSDFYLARDANNNGLLPVPMLYYRIMVDQRHPGHGIALVGVNNPHANFNEIISECVICDDVHEQVAWLRWMTNKNLKKGYLYACQVADFVKAIGHLPRHLLNVTELL
uniref:DNA/RNA non-specific endonuclease/pyrophosphatase/phosphodiesterase domain-containing protein n=1 Tax=Stomoxys calcitrans TaxID=35570 RepID=A0A1I8PGW0_STOCA